MESTWETRDLLVLEAIVRLYDETGSAMRVAAVGAVAGVSDEDDLQRALRALEHNDPPFVTKMTGSFGVGIILVGAPTGHARRVVGAWPTPDALADRIIAALCNAADNELDEAQKGKLRRAAEAVAGVGRDILTDVTAQVITNGMYGR
jgi:hypothetical protein